MSTVRMRVQNRLAYGSASVNGSDAEDRPEDHLAAADAVADRSADDRARRDGAEEQEQVDLRALHRELKAADQIERVVAARLAR